MTRFAISIGAALCLLAPADAQQASGLMTLDVVAIDRDGRPVTDLKREDFAIEDNGRKVEVQSFSAVDADGSGPAQARSMMVLLDDSGVPASGTHAIRLLAQNLLSKMGPADDIGILRLHDGAGKVATEPEAAMQVISTFAGGSFPFVATETPQQIFELVAALARKMEAAGNRRKALVCIGSPAVCGMVEVPSTALRGLYPAWTGAVDAAADANLAVYGIIPAQTQIRVSTLASVSGGEIFATTSAFGQAIDRIWNDLSHYYLLGYAPSDSTREVTGLKVAVKRRGVELRARTRRGK